MVGMEHRKNHRPAALSGGERQRVALARSVMNCPRLILADEPTGSLDSSNGERVLDLIAEISVESAISVLLVTHDSKTTHICNRIVHHGGWSDQGGTDVSQSTIWREWAVARVLVTEVYLAALAGRTVELSADPPDCRWLGWDL